MRINLAGTIATSSPTRDDCAYQSESEPDEAPPQDRTEKSEPVLENDDDGFGAGLDDDKADDAEAAPKSKEDSPRRPRRRRRRRRSDQDVESPESADVAEPQRDRQPTQESR